MNDNYLSFNNLPNTLQILKINRLKNPLLNLPTGLKELIIENTEEEIINECKIPYGCEIKKID